MMKLGLKNVVGKRILQVFVAQNWLREPAKQVFLVLEDRTYIEIYGNDLNGTRATECDGLVDVLNYAKSSGATIVASYPISASEIASLSGAQFLPKVSAQETLRSLQAPRWSNVWMTANSEEGDAEDSLA